MVSFEITLAFQGKQHLIDGITTLTTGAEIQERTMLALGLPAGTELKLLHKGKRIGGDTTVFASVPKKNPKILVMASTSSEISEIQSKRSDPTIRGFQQERQHPKTMSNQYWGQNTGQDRNYKFCRFEACTWQSFGHRPGEQTPHAFQAMELLERLATDPGVVGILKERELVVGTLGEMDPIDDRLMQQKEKEGGRLLGYNVNGGLRIDIKLRTDDLAAFLPYPQLVSTLIHELSHNWVSDHNLLFWTNFGQMRAEYLHTHAALRGSVVRGHTTAELAGLTKRDVEDVYGFVMGELTMEMAQHGLHPNMIASAIKERCDQLEERQSGQTLGGASVTGDSRQLALAAAERRMRQQEQNKEET